MSIQFSQTFQRTYEVLQAQPWHTKLHAVTVVRDVKGRIHLLLEGYRPKKEERERLNQALSSAEGLGPYWTEDLWGPEPSPKSPLSVLTATIREKRRPAPWTAADHLPAWYVLERHIAKQSWTELPRSPHPVWPITEVNEGAAPAVIAFLSFKGGVGRTTLAAAAGLILCRHGHRVALLDLDFEAPGLASSLLAPQDDRTGVIDYLIEKPIQQDRWRLRDSVYSVTDPLVIGDEGVSLRILPAGSIDADYLQKLARVDLQNLAEGDLSQTLRQLLSDLRNEIAGGLDFILLDARAGLHELGGLAVSELAHAAVLLGIHSGQSWAGLDLMIERLAKPEEEQGTPLVLVHAMAPLIEQAGGEVERQQFLERAYDIFSARYYRQGEVPSLQDPDVPHMPLVIPWQPELRGDLSLSAESQGKEKVGALVRRLTGRPYLDLVERLCLLFGRPFQRNAEG